MTTGLAPAASRPSILRRAVYKLLLVLKPLWAPLLRGRVEFFGTSHTLGDMVTEVEYYLMRRRERGGAVTSVYLVNKATIANPYLARLQKRAVGDRRTWFVMQRWLCHLLEPIERALFYAGPTAHFTQHPSDYHRLTATHDLRVGDAVTAEERARARDLMAGLGLPRDAKFVCVHAREAGFKAHRQPSGHNTYRDIDIETYLPAIDFLRAEGFWIVRMGEPTVKPLPLRERVIDYARSALKSDFLDVVLFAECELLLGCNSGLSHVAHMFRRPALWTNSIPVEMAPWDGDTLWIPKLIYSRPEGRYLTLPEIIARDIGRFHSTQDYEKGELDVHASAPEEILAATRELLARYRGAPAAPPAAVAMQDRLNRLFPPHYYAYGTRSRIAASFCLARPELVGADVAAAGNSR